MELDEEIMTKLNSKKVTKINDNDEKYKINEDFSFKNNKDKMTNIGE